MEMMEKCNVALEAAGYKKVSSKNTILDDLAAIQRDFPETIVNVCKDGRYVYYEYEDKSFSIYNIPLDDDGMAKLAQTIIILSKFEGLPNFEWIDEMIDHFKSSLNIPTTKDTIVLFDENTEFESINHFSPLFSAIASEQALLITYKPYNKPKAQYKFHPYFIKQYNKRWFLFGCIDGYEKLTNFPFDRIESIEKANIQYKPNTQYDFKDIFEDIVGVSNIYDTPETILLSVNPITYDYIRTKPLVPTQSVVSKDNKEYIVRIKTVINHELIQLILSYGAGLTVLKPQRLVDTISSELENSLKKYQSVQINCTDDI